MANQVEIKQFRLWCREANEYARRGRPFSASKMVALSNTLVDPLGVAEACGIDAKLGDRADVVYALAVYMNGGRPLGVE